MPLSIAIPISPGELFDKITILNIKVRHITEPTRQANVRAELDAIRAVQQTNIQPAPALDALVAELQTVNETLWQVEDDLRECERRQDFGPRFIELARSVYIHNDRRAELKRHINDLLGSPLVEEKSYAPY